MGAEVRVDHIAAAERAHVLKQQLQTAEDRKQGEIHKQPPAEGIEKRNDVMHSKLEVNCKRRFANKQHAYPCIGSKPAPLLHLS